MFGNVNIPSIHHLHNVVYQLFLLEYFLLEMYILMTFFAMQILFQIFLVFTKLHLFVKYYVLIEIHESSAVFLFKMFNLICSGKIISLKAIYILYSNVK